MNDTITNYSTVTNFNELPLALTVLEAGQVLRVGRNVAYELVRSGQLRSVRVGKNIRIPRDALAEYLNLASWCEGGDPPSHFHFTISLKENKHGK